MLLGSRRLGEVLVRINDFPFGASIFLPEVAVFDPDTPCVVGDMKDEEYFRQTGIANGFKNWLNVAVVSDTCDEVPDKTEDNLVIAFNEDLREGGWLRKMLNYRNPE